MEDERRQKALNEYKKAFLRSRHEYKRPILKMKRKDGKEIEVDMAEIIQDIKEKRKG